MDKDTLLTGCLISIAHAASLLDGAAVLLANKLSASSFILAVQAREEMGRANIIYHRAQKLSPTESIEVAALVKELDDHRTKIQAGFWGTRVPLPDDLLEAWRTAVELDSRAVSRQLSDKLHATAIRIRKRRAKGLHDRRLKAQYVDPNDDGSWAVPQAVSIAEAHDAVMLGIADIADLLAASHAAPIFTRLHATLPDSVVLPLPNVLARRVVEMLGPVRA